MQVQEPSLLTLVCNIRGASEYYFDGNGSEIYSGEAICDKLLVNDVKKLVYEFYFYICFYVMFTVFCVS